MPLRADLSPYALKSFATIVGIFRSLFAPKPSCTEVPIIFTCEAKSLVIKYVGNVANTAFWCCLKSKMFNRFRVDKPGSHFAVNLLKFSKAINQHVALGGNVTFTVDEERFVVEQVQREDRLPLVTADEENDMNAPEVTNYYKGRYYPQNDLSFWERVHASSAEYFSLRAKSDRTTVELEEEGHVTRFHSVHPITATTYHMEFLRKVLAWVEVLIRSQLNLQVVVATPTDPDVPLCFAMKDRENFIAARIYIAAKASD